MKGQAVLPQLLVDPPARVVLDRAYCGPDDGPAFEDSTDDWAAARTLCSRCQVVDPCLVWALRAEERHLFAGGLSPDERRQPRRRRPRA